VTHLVDTHTVLVETQVLFLAFHASIAIGRLATQMHGQVECDLVAGVGFEFSLSLNDGVFRRADKALLKVALLANVYGQVGGPALDCFGIAKGNSCSGHKSASMKVV